MSAAGQTALMLIDVQRGIDEVGHWGGNRNNPQAEQHIEALLHHWRIAELPVIIIQHCSVWSNSPFRPGYAGNALKDFIRVLPGEKLIRKSTTSAFINTQLLEYLRTRSIVKLVITGFVTNNSVEATTRNAGDLGYDCIVVSDATACFDKHGMDGSKYESSLIHQISLSNLEGEYAKILTSMETLAALKS